MPSGQLPGRDLASAATSREDAKNGEAGGGDIGLMAVSSRLRRRIRLPRERAGLNPGAGEEDLIQSGAAG